MTPVYKDCKFCKYSKYFEIDCFHPSMEDGFDDNTTGQTKRVIVRKNKITARMNFKGYCGLEAKYFESKPPKKTIFSVIKKIIQTK